MQTLELPITFMKMIEGRPTGTATVESGPDCESVFTIHRPAAFDAIELSQLEIARIQSFAPNWLYMGTLLQTEPAIETLIRNLLQRLPEVRCFYDMNLRTGHWNLSLVERLCTLASILKLNEKEAEALAAQNGLYPEQFSLESFCFDWAKRFAIDVICVTSGPDGCCIYAEGKVERFRGCSIEVSDTVGAGDAFAAGFLHGYNQGWPISKCSAFANALGALVASRPGATPAWCMEECYALSDPRM